MKRFETLQVTLDDLGVATVVLNRPGKRNAMSAQMIDELTEVAQTLGGQATTRAVVLSGAGALFCAGADLGWMRAQIAADRPTRMAEARKLAMMLHALNEMPTPLIGRIHGGAYGGALGLASVCDVVVAETETKFAFTETRLGLIPATISPYVVARMGEGRARQVFMSARVFGVAEALTLGLVSQAVDADDMADAVNAQVAPYLCVAPQAVGAAKALTRALGPRIDAAVIDDTIKRLADTWEGEEASHGIDAFLNRTAPRWA